MKCCKVEGGGKKRARCSRARESAKVQAPLRASIHSTRQVQQRHPPPHPHLRQKFHGRDNVTALVNLFLTTRILFLQHVYRTIVPHWKQSRPPGTLSPTPALTPQAEPASRIAADTPTRPAAAAPPWTPLAPAVTLDRYCKPTRHRRGVHRCCRPSTFHSPPRRSPEPRNVNSTTWPTVRSTIRLPCLPRRPSLSHLRHHPSVELDQVCSGPCRPSPNASHSGPCPHSIYLPTASMY